MYIPPGFNFITCEAIDENGLHSWAVQNGAAWRPAGDGHGGRWPASAEWEFEPQEGLASSLTAKIMTATNLCLRNWAQQMHALPQGTVNIELSENLFGGDPACAAVLSAMFQKWDGYASDLGCHDWVSELLRGLLPPERIIRYVPPPPGPLPPWVWIGGIYQRRPSDDDHNAGQTQL